MILSRVIAVAVICAALLPAGSWGQSAATPSKADLNRRSKSTGRLGRIARHGDRAIALYPDRLELFSLAADERIDNHGNFVLGQVKREPQSVKPDKIMWFSRSVSIDTQPNSPNILVCTAAWVKKKGDRGPSDFCGIITYEGNVIYKFPVVQTPPSEILFPLGISEDGRHAEVYIGSLIDGEDGKTPGAPREILIWDHPDRLSRIDGPWKSGKPKDTHSAYEEVRKGFVERTFKR